ncbi:MAG: beta strand repeat-containing protein, partial [Bacteroidia bacterium]
YSGTGTFTVSASNYSYTVTDANGCTSVTTGTVGEPTTLLASSSAGSISCNGSTTTVTVSATGGTAPYSGTGTFTVSTGNYSYTVTDANGCTSVTTGTVGQPTDLVTSSSTGSIGCNGGTTTVTVSATGGTAPYSGTGTFTVSAGNYSYTVTDANGCTSTTTGSVQEPTTLQASSSAGSIGCNGGTTTVTVSATGGTAPYSGTGTFTVSAGNYSYTVTDANGCTSVTTGTVGEPTTLLASSSAGSISCNGGTTTVTVSATGGTAPYSGTGTFTVSAGNYSYTVTDANGCSSTTTGSVQEPTTLQASSSAGSISCNGGTTTVTVSATGGTAPYSGTGTFTVSAGNYSYTVTDANGCTSVTTGQVEEPTTLQASSSAGSIDCNGGTTTVTVSATGGTAPYSGTGTFTVSAGNYSYTVTDANGCTSTTTGSVDQPLTLTATAVEGTIACYGGTTTVTITATGGTAPYSNDGVHTVSAGAYSFTVTDANQCSFTVSGNISEPDALVASSSAGTIECNGGTTSVVVSATGGTAPYSGTGTFTVSAGTYSFTVTDANQCSSTTTGTITDLDIVPPTVACQNITAQLGENGTTVILAAQINNGSSDNCGIDTMIVSPASFDCSNIGENSVILTVTDVNGNTASCNATVTVVDNLPPTAICQNITVALDEQGNATITAAQIDNGSFDNCGIDWIAVTPTSFTCANAGNNTVVLTVMDVNGNSSTCSAVVTIVDNTAPTALCQNISVVLDANGSAVITAAQIDNGSSDNCGIDSISVSPASFGCENIGVNTVTLTVTDLSGNVSTCTASVTVTGDLANIYITADGPTEFCDGEQVVLTATGGASYVWSPNGETTQSITVFTAGSYSVTVTNQFGCSGTSSATDVIVHPNPVPTVSVSGATTFCAGGSVTLTATAAASYLWSPNGETTQSITVTTSGDYMVTVNDLFGCRGTSSPVSVTVNDNPVPTISASGPTTFCAGESVILTSSSPAGNVWSPNGETTQTITVEGPGSYSVTVTDNNGCTGTSAAVDVTLFQTPVTSITASDSTTFCEGGSVTLTSANASAYVWSNGETTQSITVSASGNFSVSITDENGCSATSEITSVMVNPNPAVQIDAQGSTTVCYGEFVLLTATAPTATSYNWTPDGETTQAIYSAATGDYTVSVTDANGCSATSDTIHIHVGEELTTPVVSASGNTDLCEGESVTFTSNTTVGADYQWYQNGGALQGENANSITVSDAGSYTLTVTDSLGCSISSAALQVNVSPLPNASVGVDEIICLGNSITLTASGGTNYQWSNGETTQSITVSPLDTTDYSVVVTNQYCAAISSDTVTVNVVSNPVAEIQASDSPSLGNPVNFTDVSGDNSITNWFWDFGDGASSTTQNTHHTYDTEGLFNVILTVENQYGCTDSDTVEVEIEQIILIPNVITPNGDGFNDALDIKNNGVDNYEMIIYNRWGLIIFEDNSGDIYWDGKTVAGADAAAGTYFYVLTVANKASLGDFKQNGFITLIR